MYVFCRISYVIFFFFTFLYCKPWYITAVHGSHGVQAKPAVSTYTCIQVTCDRCGFTGDGCGMTKSHPQCDTCHTLEMNHDASQALISPFIVIATFKLSLVK